MKNEAASKVIQKLKFVRAISVALVTAVAATALGSCATQSKAPAQAATEIEPLGLDVVARFPAQWLDRITYATEDFRKETPDLNCFTVTIGWDEQVDLDFVAISPTKNLTALGGFGRVAGCGIGVAYYFGKDGSFVRREIQR